MNIEYKSFDIEDMKSSEEDGKFYLTGIANNKNKVDAHGDRPANYEGKDVYDLSRFKKNPVMLMNHDNSVESIIGSFVNIKETDKGLEFKAVLMQNPQTDKAKHAIQAAKEGFARALSIGGRWYFENPKDSTQLTKAYIHEISLVAVPADEDALTDVEKAKSLNEKHLSQDDILKQIEEKSSKSNSEELEPLIEAFRKQYELDANNKNNTGE